MTTRFINFKDISVYQVAEESPGFLLWKTHLIWKRKIEAALMSHELTHAQFVLLAALGYLAQDGGLVRQNDLAKFTSCDVTMTSQVLRTLEKKSLIERIQKQGDDRAKYPQLKKAGREKLTAAIKDVEAVDEIFFNVLGDKKSDLINSFHVLLTNG